MRERDLTSDFFLVIATGISPGISGSIHRAIQNWPFARYADACDHTILRKRANTLLGPQIQMKLLPTQTDEATLAGFGEEAVVLIMRGDFEALANRFGYALAWDREPAAALKADYERAASSPLKAKPGDGVSVVVKYFKTNDTGLFAVVECAIPLVEGAAVGMDLIVAGKGEEKSMSVEDVYGEVY